MDDQLINKQGAQVFPSQPATGRQQKSEFSKAGRHSQKDNPE
jgi:hypothetical protein